MVAKEFQGVKFHPDDRDPRTGDVGLPVIQRRMAITGRNFSEEVRDMVTFASEHYPPVPRPEKPVTRRRKKAEETAA